MWIQQQITLRARKRGFHLITDEVLGQIPELSQINVGLLHLQLQHTSASICLNENYDPDVRHDLELWCNKTMRENEPYYIHTTEGPDDMPAHIKSLVFGSSLSIPISKKQLALGTWQGIYLGEHRDHGGSRKIIATLNGSTINC